MYISDVENKYGRFPLKLLPQTQVFCSNFCLAALERKKSACDTATTVILLHALVALCQHKLITR